MLGLLLMAAGLCRPAFAESESGSAERLVKAAYLFHFFSLVDWPISSFSSAAAPLRVGIMADDALAADMQRLIASRPVSGRPIVVSKIARGATPPAVHMLFIGDALRNRLPELLSPLATDPVLTVTESEHALAFGSVINFVSVQDTLRFEISQDAAARAGLSISSRLLAVSHKFSSVSPKFRQ